MISTALSEFALSLGLIQDKDFAYGEYSGYFLTIFGNSENKSAFINYYMDPEMGENDLKVFEFSEQVKLLMESYRIVGYEIESNGINIVSSEPMIRFKELLDAIISSLSENEYGGSEYCSNCGKELNGGGKRVYVKENNYVLCAECSLDAYTEHEKSRESKTQSIEKGSTVKGIFGALAGAFAVGIVFSLVYAFVLPEKAIWGFEPGYFASWIPLVISLFALLGFKKASGGRTDTTRIGVAIVVTLVVVFLFQYLGSVSHYIRTEDITPEQFGLAGKYLFQLPFVDDAVGEMFFRYLIWDFAFAIAGLILFTYSPSKDQKLPPLKVEPLSAKEQ